MKQQSINDLMPILGTANIGTKYGITSAASPDVERSSHILNRAFVRGLTAIDTAEGYINSHTLIKGVIEQIKTIDTKIFVVSRTSLEMGLELERQLKMFGERRVRRVLAHDWHKASVEERKRFVDITREYSSIEFGASLYSLSEFFEIVNRFNELKSFQVPLNILDQRFLTVTLDSKYSSDYNFVIRSIFLQGALDWRNPTNPFRNHASIARISALAAEKRLDLTTLVLAFLKHSQVQEFVFGVTSEDQIDKLFNSLMNVPVELDFSSFASMDLGLIDPRQWRK